MKIAHKLFKPVHKFGCNRQSKILGTKQIDLCIKKNNRMEDWEVESDLLLMQVILSNLEITVV